jgi:hypothetical protein
MTAWALSRRLVLLGGGAVLVAPTAFAHRVEACFSTVEWNADASTIEVVHRLHQHDAEVAIGAAAGSNLDVDITKVRNQARAALYAEERFAVSTGGKLLDFEIVGAELRDDSVWIYREVKWPAAPGELVIADTILRDVFPAESNMVNIKMGARVRSLLFAGNDGPKTVTGLL